MHKYKVLLNKLTIGEFNDYMDAFDIFLKEINKLLDKYYGAFTYNGLPYSYGSTIWCLLSKSDPDYLNYKEIIPILDDVYSLFNLLNKSFSFEKADELISKIKNHSLDDWNFEIIKDKNEATILIQCGDEFLKTNVFSSKSFKGERFFNVNLMKVIDTKDLPKLGSMINIDLYLTLNL